MFRFVLFADTRHQAFTHRIREDCAIKVEVKLHVSEQRYWTDLRDEAQLILQKVSASLAPGLAAGAAPTSLTAAEGRKLEKWLNAMHAGPAPAVSSRMANVYSGERQNVAMEKIKGISTTAVEAPQTVDARASSARHHIQLPSRAQHEDPPASSPPPLPLLPHSAPASAHSPMARAAIATSPDASSPNSQSHLYRTPSAGAQHVSRGNYPTAASRSALPGESAGRSTSGPRTAHKFVGLREETNRDLFLKSLRSETKPTVQLRQNHILSRAVESISPPKTKPRVPELPLRPMNVQVQSSGAAERQQKLDQVRRLQAELAGMEEHTNASQKRALLTPAHHAGSSHHAPAATATARKASTASTAPPPLPYHVQQQNSAGKVDLSIFKRAGSDPIYQREVRVDVGNKLQHRAEVTNEKLGFLSGGQRRLKF
jgi:hypothetical protein